MYHDEWQQGTNAVIAAVDPAARAGPSQFRNYGYLDARHAVRHTGIIASEGAIPCISGRPGSGPGPDSAVRTAGLTAVAADVWSPAQRVTPLPGVQVCPRPGRIIE